MTKELSMQELLDQQEQLLNSIKVGDTITGTITKVNNDELTVGLNMGFDGIIPVNELNLPKNTEIAKEQAQKDIEDYIEKIVAISNRFEIDENDVIEMFKLIYGEDK